MRNISQTRKQTHSYEFLQRLLLASTVVASLCFSSFKDTVMHNVRTYDK